MSNRNLLFVVASKTSDVASKASDVASKASDVASEASDVSADSTLAVPRFRADADAFARMAKRPLATGDKSLKLNFFLSLSLSHSHTISLSLSLSLSLTHTLFFSI